MGPGSFVGNRARKIGKRSKLSGYWRLGEGETLQLQANYWRADRRHQRHVSRLRLPFPQSPVPTRLASLADFFRPISHKGAWSQANSPWAYIWEGLHCITGRILHLRLWGLIFGRAYSFFFFFFFFFF